MGSSRIKKANATHKLVNQWHKHLTANKQSVPPVKSTLDNLSIEPLYVSINNQSRVKNEEQGLPGEFPFIRGPYATMYTQRPWTIRQYAGFSTVEDSNAFYKECLKGGQQGLSVAFDLATHRGYDSDHPRVIGDVGMAGVAVDTAVDMEKLFADIPLDEVSVSMTMNGAVAPTLAMFVVAGERQGLKPTSLSGTMQNDILKEFMVRNTFIYPPDASMRIVGDVMRYCSINMPKFNAISVSGYHLQEAGATTVQELAFTLADGLEYLRTGMKAGVTLERLCPRVSFFWGIGMNFFAEVCKLRAARKLWAQLLVDKFQLNPEKQSNLLKLRTHSQTSGWSLSAQDPLNNVVRTTLEAMSAVLGGTQSLHTNSFDEALGLPTELSSRIARHTQLILQRETGLTDVIDPLAGSFYVETLTNQLYEKAHELIEQVEQMGGMLPAVKEGFPQRLIETSSAQRQALIDSGAESIIGVNCFPISPEQERLNNELFPVRIIENTKIREMQVKSLQEIKQKRNHNQVTAALEKVERAAQDPKAPLMEPIVEAARLNATVGEISDALEKHFSRYVPKMSISVGAYNSKYSSLSQGNKNDDFIGKCRNACVRFEQQHGRRPRILVAKLGQDGHDRGAKVIAGAFVDLGFDVDLGPLFATPEEVARLAISADVHVVGVSTLAAGHRISIPELMERLRQMGRPDIMVVCGGVIPPEDHPALLKLGVKAIYGPGTVIPQAALDLIAKLELECKDSIRPRKCE